MSERMVSKVDCELSVVIKALNEERNIERTLESVLAAVAGLNAEVILADSLSNDATVKIAKRFPVVIVQLLNGHERCCGIGAQLGYQYSHGRFILVMDGDMELERPWLLAALDRMKVSSSLGGVGGIVDDVNLDNIEFRARQQRSPKDMLAGPVDRLNMGGLYRRSAIKQIGYLTHRSLHACEELELGLRLCQAGWGLERLDLVSIHHYGHTVPMWTLIKRRWHSNYVNGAGELLRTSLGQPWFWHTLNCVRLPIVVVGWWVTMLVLVLCATVAGTFWLVGLGFVALLPPILLIVKKRSISMGLYSVMAWCIDTAGFLRGLPRHLQDPTATIEARILRNAPEW